jgi:hypothetical protein
MVERRESVAEYGETEKHVITHQYMKVGLRAAFY